MLCHMMWMIEFRIYLLSFFSVVNLQKKGEKTFWHDESSKRHFIFYSFNSIHWSSDVCRAKKLELYFSNKSMKCIYKNKILFPNGWEVKKKFGNNSFTWKFKIKNKKLEKSPDYLSVNVIKSILQTSDLRFYSQQVRNEIKDSLNNSILIST